MCFYRYVFIIMYIICVKSGPLISWQWAFPDCKAIADYSCMRFYCYAFIIMYIIRVKVAPKLMTFFETESGPLIFFHGVFPNFKAIA